MAGQGRIDTDWLRADWHTEEPAEEAAPPQRPPRSVQGACRTSEKRQVRAAARWIRQRVSHVDWGRKMPDEEAGKPVPKPVNLKEQVRPYLAGNWGPGSASSPSPPSYGTSSGTTPPTSRRTPSATRRC